jgi:low temperature requirement protein LtrA
VIDHEGWTSDVAAVGVAGVGLCFAVWWTYFQYPVGDALHEQRSKGFRWGYGHLFVYASIAAMGSGLHVAAYALEDHAALGTTGVVLTLAVPIAVYCVAMVVLVAYMLGASAASWGLFSVKIGVITLGVVLAASGVALPICLLVLACAPVISVVVEEIREADGEIPAA